MNRPLLFAALLLASVGAQAAKKKRAPASRDPKDPPQVVCTLMITGTDFSQTPPVPVTLSGGHSELKGFELDGKLEPICAADGGPCFGHRLIVKISHPANKAVSEFMTAVPKDIPGGGSTRFNAGLRIGESQSLANCDVMGPIVEDR